MTRQRLQTICREPASIVRALLAMGAAVLVLFTTTTGEARENFGFDLNIVLSPKAQQQLARERESLAVMVDYYGDPTPRAQSHADEVGRINLSGSYTVLLPIGATRAHVSGSRVKSQRLGWIDGPVMVNVNVISGRRSNPDNLLSCDVIDGPLSRIQLAPTTLRCGLITENPETAVRP